ncbi:hypothetical protein GN156_05790 [bacterium LRH843]|nr:hypothetical protein [bacterium LRH843]
MIKTFRMKDVKEMKKTIIKQFIRKNGMSILKQYVLPRIKKMLKQKR